MKHEVLMKVVEDAITTFPQNRLCQKIDSDDIQMRDYHGILRMIFHQTYEGPQTFALAGVNCPPRFQIAKDYLFQHAEEEKSHWMWVVNDLDNTGYVGGAMLDSLPLPPCQNYVAFNYFVALKMPIARLAIAAVLEGIGARYGAYYARKTCELLSLKVEQAQFYFGHGDTDKEHIADIWRVIDGCDLDEKETAWMCHAAKTAGNVYRSMYDETGDFL